MYRQLLTADRPRRGSVAVEYACLITIIIAILIPSIASVGWLTHQKFSALDAGPSDGTTQEPPQDPIAVPVDGLAESGGLSEPKNLLVTEFSLVFAVLAIVAVVVLAIRRHRDRAARKNEPNIGGVPLPVDLSSGLFEKRQKIQTAISTHWCKGVDGCLLVSEIMTRGPKCIPPNMPRQEAETLMHERDFHHLLVADEDGRLLGVLSTHDFDRREGDEVGDVMTPDPIRVQSTQTISAVITVLLANRVHCLPVENSDGQLVGILTGSDLAMGLQCALRALEEISLVLASQEHPVREASLSHQD